MRTGCPNSNGNEDRGEEKKAVEKSAQAWKAVQECAEQEWGN
tara:strand:- start:24487 stop:24612 length:126 start_codon:yes stop_codon:yes gene_type:complete